MERLFREKRRKEHNPSAAMFYCDRSMAGSLTAKLDMIPVVQTQRKAESSQSRPLATHASAEQRKKLLKSGQKPL